MSKQETEVRAAGEKREISTGAKPPTKITSMFDLVDIILAEGLEHLNKYCESENIHYNDPKFIEAQSALIVGQSAIRNARLRYGK